MNKNKVFLIKDNILHIISKKKKNTILFPNNFQSNLTSKIYLSLLKIIFVNYQN